MSPIESETIRIWFIRWAVYWAELKKYIGLIQRCLNFFVSWFFNFFVILLFSSWMTWFRLIIFRIILLISLLQASFFSQVFSNNFLPLVNKPVVHLGQSYSALSSKILTLSLCRVREIEVLCQPFFKHDCWLLGSFAVFTFWTFPSIRTKFTLALR